MKTFNYGVLTDNLIAGIQDYFKSAGYTDGVLGLSGGIDSAVVFVLGVKALGAAHMHALLMPNGKQSSPESISHAKLLINAFANKGSHSILDIHPMVDSIVKTFVLNSEKLGSHKPFSTLRSGNIAARVRMITLFDYAAANKCLVLGTENKSEHYLGYFTLFGDNASCVEPIRELLKTEVYDLAQYLGIPREIINKAPSADLWLGQTDEGELGFTYADADKMIELLESGLMESDKPGVMLANNKYKQITDHIGKVAFKNKLPYVVPLKCMKK